MADYVVRPPRTYLHPGNLRLRGVPKKFQKLTMDDFEAESPTMQKVKNLVQEYVSTLPEKFYKNEGILLYGSNGVGKSFIACMIVKEAYRHRYTSVRVTYSKYLEEASLLWGYSGDERAFATAEFERKFKEIEFLVLEEVGKEVDTKISVPQLEELLRFREEQGLPTIICTNLSVHDFQDRYGESVFSLVKGNCTPIKIVGEDLREDKYKERVDE